MRQSPIHKLQRFLYKKSRKKQRGIVSDTAISAVRHQKDFSWRNRKKNPFEKIDPAHHIKMIMKVSICIVSFIIMLGIGLFHSFFRIDTVTVEGTKRIEKEDIHERVDSILNYKKLFFFPGNNYFLVNVNEIRDILKEKFPIQSVTVTKTFPNSVDITIEEKIATLIYDNSKEYIKIGLDGKVIEKIKLVESREWKKITTSTIRISDTGEEILEETIVQQTHIPAVADIVQEVGDYPLIYDTVNTSTIEEDQTRMEPHIAERLLFIYEYLKKQTTVELTYMELQTQGSTLIHTKNGLTLFMTVHIHPETQLQTLEYLLQSKDAQIQASSYIDVRYLPQVYWR